MLHALLSWPVSRPLRLLLDADISQAVLKSVEPQARHAEETV